MRKRIKKEKEEIWAECYKLNKRKFNLLKIFLKNNHKQVCGFQRKMAISHVSNFPTAAEKLYMLFLNSLRAAGGNNLTSSAKATKQLLQHLEPFQSKRTIPWNKFMNHLGIKTQNSDAFFNHLISYPNFKYKKAALFLIQLKYLQNTKHKIFSGLNRNIIKKQIPLDIIIGETISKMMKLPYSKRITSSDAAKFNEWAREVWGKDFILFEDIWFWGYLATEAQQRGNNSNKKINRYRKFTFNKAKLNTLPWIYPPKLDFVKPKINEFISIIKSK